MSKIVGATRLRMSASPKKTIQTRVSGRSAAISSTSLAKSGQAMKPFGRVMERCTHIEQRRLQ